MHKLNLTHMVIAGTAMVFTSCSKEETTVPVSTITTKSSEPGTQSDTITSFTVYFGNPIDSSAQVGVYEDKDGPGPIPPVIGGVTLAPNTTYDVTFFIEDASNPKNVVYIHNKIKNYASQYKICTSNPLGSTVYATDTDGRFPVGLVNKLITTDNTGDDMMNFTIKYQKDVKNGSCTPGTVYFSCNIPVSVN